MTDIAPAAEAPAPDTAPVADAPAAPEAAAEDTSRFGEHEKYIKELRAEAAGYRTKAKQYEEAFSAYNDDERAVWLELATGLTTDAPGTAKRLQEIAKAILGDESASAEATEAAEAVVSDDDTPLTKAQVNALLVERETAADLERRVGTIKSTAKELGYTEGTVAYRTLLITAQEKDGDINAAHAAIQAERQGVIDAYLASKVADAEGSPTPGSGATAGQEKQIKSFGEASDALREMMTAKGYR